MGLRKILINSALIGVVGYALSKIIPETNTEINNFINENSANLAQYVGVFGKSVIGHGAKAAAVTLESIAAYWTMRFGNKYLE